MSMWTYVTKVPNKTIFADIAEYKRLCERIANARRVYNISRARLTVDNAKGCIYIRLYDVPDFGRDNDSGVFVCQEFCEHFTYTDSCNKSQCKYYQNNVAYFNAKYDLYLLQQQRKDFWTQKFANCR